VVRLSVTKRDIRASGSTGWRIRRGQTSYSPREIGGLAIKPANSKTFYPDEEVLGKCENFRNVFRRHWEKFSGDFLQIFDPRVTFH
jgi:hypothetical protein